MKTLIKKVLVLIAALSVVTISATAGSLTINANAANGSNYYDSITNISVPAGAYCSYNEYVVGGGSAQVQVDGPGVSINNTIYTGATGGGSAFSSAGNVSGSVYASSSPSYPGSTSAHAGLTIGW